MLMASTSHNPTQSSSASTSRPTKWDVFLSFRGIDTRDSFTDFLYHSLHRTGIRTFRDEPELRGGEVISDTLIQAIQESMMYVVVLSENYASSRWCLDELVEILRCCESMDRLVLPVFYNIEPSVVRHQTGSIGEAFQKHANRFDGNYKLYKWRHTLEVVANFSGYEVRKNKSQVDVINEIVAKVLDELNPSTFDEPKYQVGLDSRAREIVALLSRKGVTRIGIYGMGGVGKTTISKAVYNQIFRRFEGSCFLENVREASQTREGIVCVQRKLIKDVLKCKEISIDNVDQGINFIRARMCLTKVLVVIDDLDNASSLDFLIGTFASESAIIITTRNGDLLDSINIDAQYKASELDDADSRLLFCQHAFGGDTVIPDNLRELVEEILKRAGGLPLALQICGSALLNKNEEGWRWYIDKLRRVSIGDVEKILLTSFDALKLVDPMLQNIFLDIACFFIGIDEKEVINVMKIDYTSVNYSINILKKRCLVFISNKKIMMHDLLTDMGRRIACNPASDVLDKRTRLWVSQDIQKMLKENKGIEGISDFDIYLESIIMSNLPRSFIHTFKYLKKFCIKKKYLKNSIFRFCRRETVHLASPGTQGLRHVVSLNLRGCEGIKRLPESICDLRALRRLDIGNCSDLEEIPMNLGNIKTLAELNADWLTICKLPHSIGRLSKLIKLDLSFCRNLETLPDSICNLRSLKILNISWCSRLKVLPTELRNLDSLVELKAETLPSASKLLLIKHLI